MSNVRPRTWPNLTRALALGSGEGWPPVAADYAYAESQRWARDRSVGDWYTQIEQWVRAHADLQPAYLPDFRQPDPEPGDVDATQTSARYTTGIPVVEPRSRRSATGTLRMADGLCVADLIAAERGRRGGS